MNAFVTIIYANRNRDLKRIKASLDSLEGQSVKRFEVVFVDYGSDLIFVKQLRKLKANYSFVKFFFLEVSQLLWNKSKALNFGITQASTSNIFIADVDLIFHPKVITLFDELLSKDNIYLFNMGYLNQKESNKLHAKYEFDELKPERFNNVNGMILGAKEAFLAVNGFDEFFHFYGSEDVDLFSRMENAGYVMELIKTQYFYHNWHISYSSAEDRGVTLNPRVKNIMRLNQRHYLRNRKNKIIKPNNQNTIGNFIKKVNSDLLKSPTLTFKISNVFAHVEHILREELPSYSNQVVKIEFVEDPYFHTLKYKVKKLLGRQTQPYCNLKDVNDMILKEILFKYRDYNYSFNISEDLKKIEFVIEL
jgi:glycosyltransferase involved in cell wall biosynthesis